jgi:predicted DNA-binding transcriptional regulator YafY
MLTILCQYPEIGEVMKMKVDRLISIILLLLERKKVSAKELSETFEVSLRTIYRDIDTINMAGIPIVSTSGVNGGFQIMEKYKVDKKVFSASDIVLLLKGLESVSSVLSSEDIINTLVKIRSLIPTEKADEIELKSNQILIDLQPWKGNPKLQSFLNMINEALQEQRLISFEYFDRKGRMSKRTIEPYKLMLKMNSWYIQGYCLEKQDFRLFKLSRMSDLNILEEAFEARELPPIITEFIDMMDKRQITVKLLVHESARDRLMEYCGSENITQYGEHEFIAQIPFINDDDGYNLLLSFGEKCECLEPKEVRNEMIRRIESILKRYSDHDI